MTNFKEFVKREIYSILRQDYEKIDYKIAEVISLFNDPDNEEKINVRIKNEEKWLFAHPLKGCTFEIGDEVLLYSSKSNPDYILAVPLLSPRLNEYSPMRIYVS